MAKSKNVKGIVVVASFNAGKKRMKRRKSLLVIILNCGHEQVRDEKVEQKLFGQAKSVIRWLILNDDDVHVLVTFCLIAIPKEELKILW